MGKVKFCLVLLAVLLGITGCQGLGVGTTQSSGPDKMVDLIVQEESQIKLGSGVATTVALLAVDSKDRAEVGQVVFQVAEAINSAVQTDNAKLSDIRDLANRMVAKSKIKQKDAVSYLLSTVSDLIEARLSSGSFKDADANARYQAAKALLRGASAGIMQATGGYKLLVILNPDLSDYLRWLQPTQVYRYG